MSVLIEVWIERQGVSDDQVVVTSVLVSTGALVEQGEVLAIVETSKAAHDVESPARGYFHIAFQEGDHVGVGEVLGYVTDSAEPPAELEARRETAKEGDGPLFSASALARLNALGLDRAAFSTYEIVTAADVEEMARTGVDEGAAAVLEHLPAEGVVIFGAGGYAKMCIDLMRGSGAGSPALAIAPGSSAGTTLLGLPVLSSDSDETLAALLEAGVRDAVVAIGHGEHRVAVARRLAKAGFRLPALVHTAAVVEPSATVSDGAHVHALAYVGSLAFVGMHTIINNGAIVSHDCVIGEGVHVAPGALLAGHVEVGDGAVFGMGASAYIGVRVGARALVSNGVALFDHVPEGAKIAPEREGRG